MHGKGEYRYPNGDKYIGMKYLKYYLGYFVKDKKQGLGKFIWNNGKSAEG